MIRVLLERGLLRRQGRFSNVSLYQNLFSGVAGTLLARISETPRPQVGGLSVSFGYVLFVFWLQPAVGP